MIKAFVVHESSSPLSVCRGRSSHQMCARLLGPHKLPIGAEANRHTGCRPCQALRLASGHSCRWAI
jgi:hypothetical protein